MTEMTPQTFKVEICPMQRWIVFNLARAPMSDLKNEEEGRGYRRMCEAAGLNAIRENADRGLDGGYKAHPIYSLSRTRATFSLTSENIDQILSIYKSTSRTRYAEEELGDLMDYLIEINTGRIKARATTAPDFDPSVDGPKWKVPEVVPAPTPVNGVQAPTP